jgi:hypothetical protein
MLGMRFTHGKISLDIPENWSDVSQIAFMAPAESDLADDFAKRAAAAGAPINLEIPAQAKSRANFAVSVRPYFLEMDAKEFCGTELKAMLTNMPNAKASEIKWIKIGEDEAACADLELEMEGMALKQFHCLTVLGGGILHFCGTASVGDYADTRSVFVAAIKSLRIDA